MNAENIYQFDLFTDYCLSANVGNVVSEALLLLEGSMRKAPVQYSDVSAAQDFCRLKLASLEHEVFGVLFLDTQHRLIEFKELFRGTIDSCSVYPREVTKEALALNAAAVIFTHNHPSGFCEPSQGDIHITEQLKKTLGLFDVRVLDHIIVTLGESYSLAQRGLV